MILKENFSYKHLESNSYKNVVFNNIVFCEGAKTKNNPFFNYLPFSLNKGQLLTIESSALKTKTILKKKAFILPRKGAEFSIGATFSWKWEDEFPEDKQTKLLQEQLEEMTSASYRILKEDAGIRPATRDRRPFVGQHHSFKNYFIFNGMGAKGCLMAPLLTAELVEHIETQKPLDPEMNIRRYDRFKPS